MYKGKTILAIIPARGGSRRLPNKNLKPLNSHPLVAWSIMQAKGSSYIDHVFVSTDSPAIASISKKYKCPVPELRPKKYALDTSPTIEAIRHVLGYWKNQGFSPDYVVLLEPTSPLRKDNDIDLAIAQMIDASDTADALISVGQIHLESPFLAKTVEGTYLKPLIKEKNAKAPKTYFPYGVIYMSKTKTLLQAKTFYQKNIIPYFIERWQNYEIDDIYDFWCIEKILKNIKNKGQKK